MLTLVALSVRTSTRAVTATDTATAIGEPSVDTIRVRLLESADELEQNCEFAPEAMARRGRVAFMAAKEDRSR
jgi:hypothetical protein